MDRLASHPAPMPRQQNRALAAAWAVSLVVLLLAAGTAIAWRDDIIQAWPPSARVFIALGLAPPSQEPSPTR
jgi:hypothetical protein